jgi:hypothetical protein
MVIIKTSAFVPAEKKQIIVQMISGHEGTNLYCMRLIIGQDADTSQRIVCL